MKNRILYWTPRGLAILAILFLMMFSLDCFGEYQEMREMLTCFVMHNIPAFIVIGVLIIAWKWEFIGGVLFILAAIAGAIFFNGFGSNSGVLILMAPFVITGALFILHYYSVQRTTA
jgi:hypothetical protein